MPALILDARPAGGGGPATGVAATVPGRPTPPYVSSPVLTRTASPSSITHSGGEALVFAVRPVKVLAFGKGGFSQTRHRFRAVGAAGSQRRLRAAGAQLHRPHRLQRALACARNLKRAPLMSVSE